MRKNSTWSLKISRAGDLMRLSMKVCFQLVNGIYATFKSDCLLNCYHEYSRAIMRFPTRFRSHFPEGFKAPSSGLLIQWSHHSTYLGEREPSFVLQPKFTREAHKSLWTSRDFVANKNEAYHRRRTRVECFWNVGTIIPVGNSLRQWMSQVQLQNISEPTQNASQNCRLLAGS